MGVKLKERISHPLWVQKVGKTIGGNLFVAGTHVFVGGMCLDTFDGKILHPQFGFLS